MPVLDVKDLSVTFGGLKAVNQFSLDMPKGGLIGLIGPNGAGKTTVFNLLTGVYKPNSGTMELEAENGQTVSLIGSEPWKIARLGMTRTFQNIRLFKRMTVLDNVKVSIHPGVKYNPFQAMLRLPVYRREEERIDQQAMELLELLGLQDKAEEMAASLPYGEQRKLEIARALGARPKILLLDEPAAGMNPQETKELTSLIRTIRDKLDITILLIEHDMSLVMSICERLLVLDYGTLIADGSPEEIRTNPQVIKAYLGEEVGGSC